MLLLKFILVSYYSFYSLVIFIFLKIILKDRLKNNNYNFQHKISRIIKLYCKKNYNMREGLNFKYDFKLSLAHPI